MSAIRPNPEQFKVLAAAASDRRPVVMLNLLKFKRGDGARAYGEYGRAAREMVERQGGRVLYMGRCDQILIGDEDWDAVALVEYPSRQAFIRHGHPAGLPEGARAPRSRPRTHGADRHDAGRGAEGVVPVGRKILFITTDQMRYDSLGCNGGKVARTPVIDGLAASGINYRRANNQNVVCMPARSSMITG
ncbi:MAG: DUF1330 domain-containing protein, partial [Dehalococcoidia bacterium]